LSAAVIGCTAKAPVAQPDQAHTAAATGTATAADDCSDPDLVLYSGENQTGDKLCLSGPGDYDLTTLFHDSCTDDGQCIKLWWANNVHSWSSKRAFGAFFARVNYADSSEPFHAHTSGTWVKAVSPDGYDTYDDILPNMYKVTIRYLEGAPPGPTAGDDCSDPDLVFYQFAGRSGDRLCFSGVGDYDLTTLFHDSCDNDGQCTKVSWADTIIQSWTSAAAAGTFFARQDGVESSETFRAWSGDSYFKGVAPDGTFVNDEVLGHMYKVSIRKLQAPPPPPSETGDCRNPDLVLFANEGWSGDKLCLSGVGDYDLATLTRTQCNDDGECSQVSWANSIHSYISNHAAGTFYALQDGVASSETFAGPSWGDYFKDVAPDGTLEWHEVWSHSVKVSITSVVP